MPAKTFSTSGSTSRPAVPTPSPTKVYDRIEQTCRLLKHNPQLGPARPEIAEDARALVIERWIALYRLVEDGVQVVRIVDGVRDLTRVEWTPDS
jgi:toxin ParE1/3/4